MKSIQLQDKTAGTAFLVDTDTSLAWIKLPKLCLPRKLKRQPQFSYLIDSYSSESSHAPSQGIQCFHRGLCQSYGFSPQDTHLQIGCTTAQQCCAKTPLPTNIMHSTPQNEMYTALLHTGSQKRNQCYKLTPTNTSRKQNK